MRNQMHSFAATPDANIPRSRFNMPCNVKFTGNAGKLIPFYVCEVLPGDTFEVSTSLVCRLQTLIHPLMDNMYLDTYFFLSLIVLFGIIGSTFVESLIRLGYLIVNGLFLLFRWLVLKK